MNRLIQSTAPAFCITHFSPTSARMNITDSGGFSYHENGGITFRSLNQFSLDDNPPKWMRCPYYGVRNRTDHKTVLTYDCCGDNLEANIP